MDMARMAARLRKLNPRVAAAAERVARRVPALRERIEHEYDRMLAGSVAVAGRPVYLLGLPETKRRGSRSCCCSSDAGDARHAGNQASHFIRAGWFAYPEQCARGSADL